MTGGAAGIGRAIATAFCEAGANVHVADLDGETLQAFSSETAVGTTSADVSEPADVERLFREALENLGGLDVLVNNAGTAGPTGPVERLEFDAWQRTLATNLDSQFLCSRAAVESLKDAGGGSIVNLSSTAGLHGYPFRSPYAAAKWGVIGFTKTLAMELGPHGIRVNAICPGSVDGDRVNRVIEAQAKARGVDEDAIRDSWVRQTSMRTFIRPEDIAALVLFITSEAGSKISGQALPVDGFTEGLGT